MTDEEIVDTFLDYITYFSIAHHIPGRIRIKASLLKAAKLRNVATGEIEEVVDSLPGITDYRVNKKGLSAVIEYDTKVIAPDLWEAVAGVDRYPATRPEVKERLLALLNRKG